MLNLFIRWIDNHFAMNPVNNQQVAIMNDRSSILDANDSGQGKGLTHNRKMRGPPPISCNNPCNISFIKLSGISRRNIISHKDCPVV